MKNYKLKERLNKFINLDVKEKKTFFIISYKK